MRRCFVKARKRKTFGGRFMFSRGSTAENETKRGLSLLYSTSEVRSPSPITHDPGGQLDDEIRRGRLSPHQQQSWGGP
jgi:hypothetical protein